MAAKLALMSFTKKQTKQKNCESFVLIEKMHSISDRCSHALPVLNTHTQISPLTILIVK